MRIRYITFVLLLIVIGQAAVDIYLPSLPHMVNALNTTATAVQLSLTGFLVGFGLSQLIYGPVSDHFGRNPTLYIGLLLFLAGSIGCSFAPNVEVLFFMRAIQGLGVGACSVMSKAIARDKFEGKELGKVSSYMSVAWAMVPMIAPVVGGYVQTYLGWRYNFVLLAVFALIFMIAIYFLLPETMPEHDKNHKVNFIKNYKTLLESKTYIKYILCVMLIYGFFVYFNIAGPFLIQDIYHQSAVAYGWWVLFTGCGYLVGSLITSYLINYLEGQTLINFGFINIAIISAIFFCFELLNLVNIFTLVIPMFLIFMSMGLAFPHCITGALGPFPKIAGSASALFGCMVFLGGTIASLIISHLPESSAIPLASIILVQALLLLAVNFLVGEH